jgi:hypothetical protein
MDVDHPSEIPPFIAGVPHSELYRPNHFVDDLRPLRKKYPLVRFGMYGWEGSAFECNPWTQDQTVYYRYRAHAFGYDGIFMAPGFAYDQEVKDGLKHASLHGRPTVLLHHPGHEIKLEYGLMAFPAGNDEVEYHLLSRPAWQGEIWDKSLREAFADPDTEFVYPNDPGVFREGSR